MRWIVVNAVRIGLGVLLALLMAPQGWAIESYGLQGNQLTGVHHRRQLPAPDGLQAAIAKEHERLLHERDQARAETAEWARQQAVDILGATSGSYREALRLYQEGKLDAALERLGEDSLPRDVADAQQETGRCGAWVAAAREAVGVAA